MLSSINKLPYWIRLCLTTGLILAVLVPPTLWVLYRSYLQTPLTLGDQPLVFEIPANSNLSQAVRELALSGYLNHHLLLVWHARFYDRTLVQAGEYLIEPGTTPLQLLDKFNKGDVRMYAVTLVEGQRFRELRQRLESDYRFSPDTRGLSEEELLERLGLEIDHAEGWFFPDTYSFARGTRVSRVLLSAHERMRTILAEEWQGRDSGLPLESSYEALILASIVEKETGVASERPAIAGVFVRRLQLGMRLQTDPTVIYGLGDEYDGNIRRADLSRETAYNTYKIRGLPPTPIAAAGREALTAVLHPEAGNSLYFVAKGDGSHYFSSTLEEHNQAVRKYQIEQRARNYRSAPAGSSGANDGAESNP